MLFIICIFLIFLVYSIWEYRRHRENLKALAIRVLVNGSRGKSSVTRLIAAGLRAGGIRTFAKTTGTAPRMIYPDGKEKPINRRGNANIIEQKRIAREAVIEEAEAIVFECMSLRPELQRIEGNKMVDPTLYVITNVRNDHLDVMGPTVYDSARFMMASVPKNSVVFTAEGKIFTTLKREGDRLGIRIVSADADGVSDEEMGGFGYIEHRENVALALSVLGYLGVDEKKALSGMYNATPDPGALRIYRIKESGKEIHFINAMAANDPDSVKLIWVKMGKNYEHKLVLINCRADRIERSRQFADLCARELPADGYILTGYRTKVFKKRALSLGIAVEKIHDLEGRSVPDIYEEVLSISRDGTLIFATGNIVILGHEIVDYFASKVGYGS
ncbi:poly-gamma-glutamate synthase PgsB [candidate division WOR-3 bacterium JGI_Cruoil_03_44_89]|uniref:Poly-gamma-glutamate synthase PgsB n=1 Tax=candidate division WOR-3 bacterium JGI_Cruoil_03_44_89 TaxID=1973748 RepID=A0A235BSF5_UNCW3|nr:MAG: poly-gamma-glutamate synthase PgsB [candidate division WOR-3 bacterium JGI_Cruoil_03_44_89]